MKPFKFFQKRKQVVAVVAFNQKHFLNWKLNVFGHNRGPNDTVDKFTVEETTYIKVTSHYDIRGRRFTNVIQLDTAEDNPRYGSIMYALENRLTNESYGI